MYYISRRTPWLDKKLEVLNKSPPSLSYYCRPPQPSRKTVQHETIYKNKQKLVVFIEHNRGVIFLYFKLAIEGETGKINPASHDKYIGLYWQPRVFKVYTLNENRWFSFIKNLWFKYMSCVTIPNLSSGAKQQYILANKNGNQRGLIISLVHTIY